MAAAQMYSTSLAAPAVCRHGSLQQQRRGRHQLRAACSADGSGVPCPSRTVGTQQTVQLTLRKPLGLVLAERKLPSGAAQVFVEEVTPGGNAAKDGRIQAGDVLTKCSATILKAGKEGEFEREGYGQRPYDNWEQVMFNCEGKQFDTVMAALGSNSERWGINKITLELQRPLEP